jgi:outer membrane protein insertion porin family
VKISTDPGSAPDRVVLNVDVEEQATGEFSVSGGYSTADGFIGEVSVAERNLLGRGLYGKIGVQYGQYTKGATLSYVDPYFLGYRVAMGIDLFYKQQLPTSYVSYETETYGGGTRLGFALREDLSLQLRYSLYQQKITLTPQLTNCNNINPDFVNTFPTPDKIGTTPAPYPAGRICRDRELLCGRRGLACGESAWRTARFSPRSSVTRSRTTRSTTTGIRRRACWRSSGRISPASAAT